MKGKQEVVVKWNYKSVTIHANIELSKKKYIASCTDMNK